LRGQALNRLKWILTLLIVAGTTAAGTTVVLSPDKPEHTDEVAVSDAEWLAVNDGRTATDADGDPLPPGAVMRLGSARFRTADRILALAYTADGSRLVSAGPRGLIHTWDARTGRPVATVRRPGLMSTTVNVLSPDGEFLATTSAVDSQAATDATKIYIARVKTNSVIHTLDAPGPVSSVSFSPDGRFITAGGFFKQLLVWDVYSGRVVHRLPLKIFGCRAVALAPGGEQLAAVDCEDKMRLWDLGSRGEKAHEIADGFRVASLDFSADGRSLVGTTAMGGVQLREATTGRMRDGLDLAFPLARAGVSDGIRKIALSSDARLVAAISVGNAIILRSADSGEKRLVLQEATGPSEGAWTLVFSPDDRYLAVGGDGAEIRVWDTATGERVRVTNEAWMGLSPSAVSLDGKYFATMTPDRQRIQLRDARTGVDAGILGVDSVARAAYTRDGLRLATPSGVASLAEFTDRLSSNLSLWAEETVAFSGDQQWLATSGNRGVAVARIRDRRFLWQLPETPLARQPAVFSPNGKFVAYGTSAESGAYSVVVRDTSTGREIRRIPCPGPCWAVTFHPDGDILAVAGEDYARLHETSSGQLRRQLERVQSSPRRFGSLERRPMVFSPDGKVLAAAGPNHTILLWDTDSGKRLVALSGHRGQILSLAFTPDGERLLSGSNDTTALVWDVAHLVTGLDP
jgi:WD40 repeat protein